MEKKDVITVKEIEASSMTEEKRKEAKNNIFAFFIGRPISYLLTIPFIYMKTKPNTITLWSMLWSFIGFGLVSFGSNISIRIFGVICFFLWNLFDGIDGNIARYTKQYSNNGDLWDTTSGYIAIVATFYSMGIAAFYDNNYFAFFSNEWMLILGGASAIFSILPRLVLHKKNSYGEKKSKADKLTITSSYGLLKMCVFNLTAISGFIQIFMLLAIIFHLCNIFTVFYFIVNFFIMFLSIYELLKEA